MRSRFLVFFIFFAEMCFASGGHDTWVHGCEMSSGEIRKTYSAIRDIAGIISKADCSQAYHRIISWKKLDLSHKGISDISPLIFFKNLEELDISNNKIKEIVNLKYLAKLSFVHLSHNQIFDFEGVAEVDYVAGKDSQLHSSFIPYSEGLSQELGLERGSFGSVDANGAVEENLLQNIALNELQKQKNTYLLKIAILYKLCSVVSALDYEKSIQVDHVTFRKTSFLLAEMFEEVAIVNLIRSAVKTAGVCSTIAGTISLSFVTGGLFVPVGGALVSAGIGANGVYICSEVDELKQIVDEAKAVVDLLLEEKSLLRKALFFTKQKKLGERLIKYNKYLRTDQWRRFRKEALQIPIGDELIKLQGSTVVKPPIF